MTTLAAYLDRADVVTAIGSTPVPAIATYLGVVVGDYADLRAQYGEAIDWCNTKLSGKDFVDSAGASTDPPDAVVLGVYAYVRATRDIDSRGSTGVKKTKTGAREEEYADTGQNTYLLPGQAAWPKLEPYCADVTLFASGGA